jgi:hypothetical protein
VNLDSKERNSQVVKIVWQILAICFALLHYHERFESVLEYFFQGENQ